MKVGDRVVCVKSHSKAHENGIIKDKIFTILNIMAHYKCGCVIFDIGISSGFMSTYTKCRHGDSIPGGSIWWISSRLFSPLEFNSAHDELLNKEVVEEKYDGEIKEQIKTPENES
jgi:hypothetical protein